MSDEWRKRAEFAERELSEAFGLPPTIGPVAGEAARVVRELRAQRDAALARAEKAERERDAERARADEAERFCSQLGCALEYSEKHYDKRVADWLTPDWRVNLAAIRARNGGKP